MHRRSHLVAAALLAATATSLVAGCGTDSGGAASTAASSSNSSPRTELVNAVRALGHASALTTTVRLQTTPAALAHDLNSGHSAVSSAEANALASGQLVLEATAPSGKTLDTAGKTTGASSVMAESGSTTYAQLCVLNGTVYLQADLRDVLRVAGKTSSYDTLATRVKSLPRFVQAFVAGGWVSLPMSTATGLAGAFGGGASTGTQTPGAGQSQAILRQLEGVFARDVTVTRLSHGTTDQLQLSADTRVLGKDLLAAVGSAVPGIGTLLGKASAEAFPKGTLHLTATVAGGALTGLSLDLGQLDPALGQLPLTVRFARSGPTITAPATATPVDASQLGALVGALTGKR